MAPTVLLKELLLRMADALVRWLTQRRDEAVAMNIYGEQDLKIFEAGVEYFR